MPFVRPRAAAMPPRGPARGAAVRALAAVVLVAVVALLAPAPVAAQGSVHVVQPGDTLYGLAERYGTTVEILRERNGLAGSHLSVGAELTLPGPPGWRRLVVADGLGWRAIAERVDVAEATLREANPTVASPGGQEVRIPPDAGELAAPRADEDLVAFAARLGVAPGALAVRNGLEPPYRLTPGAPLLLPVAERAQPGGAAEGDAAAVAPAGVAPAGVAPAAIGSARADASDGAAAAVAPTPSAADSGVDGDAPRGGIGGTAEGDVPSHETLRASALATLPELLRGSSLVPPDDGFDWPLARPRRITSSFGWRAIAVAGNRYHQGLDLGAPSGTPVRAARDGTVVRTGWVGAYGYAVYVRHAEGYETRYAHLSQVGVEVGAAVRRGETIGRVGSTGASTGPHLHFEVRSEGRALDPLGVLPDADAASSTSR